MSMEAVKYAKKVEINPTNIQEQTINQTIGNCRFIFNFFIAENKRLYESLHPEKFKEDNDDEYETKYYNYRKKVKAIRDDIAAKMVDINFSDFSLDMIDKAYDEIKNSLSQERMEFPRLKYKVDELTAREELDINPDKKKLYNRYKNMDSESLYILLANTEPSALEEREMIREILEYRKNNDFEKVLSSRKVFNRKYRSLDDLLSRLNKNKQKVKRRVKK